jgi:hypothetical protein
MLIHLCSLDCPWPERPAVESFKSKILQATNGSWCKLDRFKAPKSLLARLEFLHKSDGCCSI